jgi:hypothetical protein
LCSNSAQQINDFLGYGFVGSPFNSPLGRSQTLSGGLSLRRRAAMLEVVKVEDWNFEMEYNPESEDQQFYKNLQSLPNVSGSARIPSIEVAKKFSVETL